MRSTSQGTSHKFIPMAPDCREPLGLVSIEIIRNIQAYEATRSLQRLSSGSVGNSGGGENYCGQNCSQAKSYQTFRLNSSAINCKTVHDCRSCHNEMANLYDVCIA